MSKVMRSPVVDPMGDYDLFREWECYAAAENDEAARRNAERQREVQASRSRRR